MSTCVCSGQTMAINRAVVIALRDWTRESEALTFGYLQIPPGAARCGSSLRPLYLEPAGLFRVVRSKVICDILAISGVQFEMIISVLKSWSIRTEVTSYLWTEEDVSGRRGSTT